jgi:hypothetical protein
MVILFGVTIFRNLKNLQQRTTEGQPEPSDRDEHPAHIGLHSFDTERLDLNDARPQPHQHEWDMDLDDTGLDGGEASW